MVERIRTLLETQQLTPTQFADAIGVARPIVSHILSGRNKPSLDVVQRILAAMPDLSMPWLLNGTGPMLATAVAPMPAAPVLPVAATPPAQVAKIATTETASPTATAEIRPSAGSQRRLGSATTSDAPAQGSASAMPRRFTASAIKAKPTPHPKPKPGTPLTAQSETAPVAIPNQPAMEPENTPEPSEQPVALLPKPAAVPDEANRVNATAAALFAGAEKPIRRIVIFYRDGSFADYQPE